MSSSLPEPTEEAIRDAAYLLWVEEGRPSGRALEFWLTARMRLMHARTRSAIEHLLPRSATPTARNAQSTGRKYR